jgi:hypothetical protein
MATDVAPKTADWRTNGIRVVHADQKGQGTPETLSMSRQVGSRTGSTRPWAGTNRIEPA